MLNPDPNVELNAHERSRAGLQHWPDEICSDYPVAYVRMTTLRVDDDTHLLFGCVELLPREIAPLPSHQAPRLNLPRGATAMSSLTVLATDAALRWYESVLAGAISIPGTTRPAIVRTVRLAPEPRLGDLVVARTPTVPVAWTSGPRMHRMVPMEPLPDGMAALLTPTSGSSALRDWMLEHCFIDLAAHPDCAGGLVLLAANPIIRHASEYPLRKLPDGREVLGIRLVPRLGCSLETVKVRLSEIRPDGIGLAQEVALDAFGEAEVTLSQEALDTALEVSCSRRGLLHVAPHTGFLRSIGFEMRPVRAKMSVEVPARSKTQAGSRYDVPVADSRLNGAGQIGRPAETGAASRLASLLAARAQPVGRIAEQVVFRDDRPFAVTFVRGLVAHAHSRALFVDPYFSFDDIRDFALSAWSGSCIVSVLTSVRVGWTKRVQHLATEQPHGDMMIADLEQINRIRNGSGLSSVEVAIMGEPGIHDRFLVVDDAVWHFGDSFRSLGGALSMASKVRDMPSLLPMLLDAQARATAFAEYWARANHGSSAA